MHSVYETAAARERKALEHRLIGGPVENLLERPTRSLSDAAMVTTRRYTCDSQ
jgi:hypothetical protein